MKAGTVLPDMKTTQAIKAQLEIIDKKMGSLEKKIATLSESKSFSAHKTHHIVAPQSSKTILKSYMREVSEIENALEQIRTAKSQLGLSDEKPTENDLSLLIKNIEERLEAAKKRVELQEKSNETQASVRQERASKHPIQSSNIGLFSKRNIAIAATTVATTVLAAYCAFKN